MKSTDLFTLIFLNMFNSNRIKIKQEELAQMMHITLPTLQSSLQRLEDKGYLIKGRGVIYLDDKVDELIYDLKDEMGEGIGDEDE